MAKGEIAHYVFKKPSAAEASESVYMRERVKVSILMSMLWEESFSAKPVHLDLFRSPRAKGSR